MPRWPPGLNPYAQSGRGGPGQQAVKRVVPTSIFAYGRKITQVPLQPGQAETILTPITPAIPAAALAQAAVTGTGTASPLALTLGTPTTAGNTLLVAVNASGSVSNPTVSGITIGGSPSTFIQRVGIGGGANPSDVEIWECFNVPGGQTAISISFTGGSVTFVYSAQAEEWSGLPSAGAFDKSASAINNTSSPAFNSGTTATLSQANEVAIGIANGQAASVVVTGPASPWVNSAGIGTTANRTIVGSNILSATTGLAYSGTYAPNSAAASAIATFKALGPVAAGAGTGQVTVGPVGVGTVWYPAQVTVSTTTGPTDSSTFNLYLGPAGVPITLVGTLFPGGAGTLALAIPPMSPGQYLIGIWTGGHVGDLASMNVIGTMDAVTI